jgi:hypothetical protein
MVAKELDVSVFSASSVKAVLDVDWREPQARSAALCALLGQFERLREWLETHFEPEQLEGSPLSDQLKLVERIVDQDTEPDPDDPGSARIRQGVAADRRVSISDPDMRHGRKTRTKAFNGYKRHVVVDADVQGLICGVEVQPANLREYEAAGPLLQAIAESGRELTELHIDRGYLPAPEVVAKHAAGVTVISKPPSPARSPYFRKSDFEMDFDAMTASCPADVTIPLRLGKTISFPAPRCRECQLRPQCTPSRARQLSIHAQEPWYRQMAAELATPEGRQRRRDRIPVEHALARISSIQGNRARFRGHNKNQFDLERTAVVNNCYVLDALWKNAA